MVIIFVLNSVVIPPKFTTVIALFFKGAAKTHLAVSAFVFAKAI